MIPTSPVDSVSSSPMSDAVGLGGASKRAILAGAIAGLSSLGLMLAPWATTPALANGSCEAGSNSTAVCCNGQAVQGAIPNLSASFAEDVCQILTMPTVSRSEGENFLNQIEPGSLLTHTSASAEAMTLPSMWWTRDSIPPQLGRHRLVDSWVSYTVRDSDVQVVDVTINSQFWRALTMPQRYGVLNKFGSSAQEFGYHLRFFHSNGYSARIIGLYSCAVSPGETLALSTPSSTTNCLVTVDAPRIVQWQRAVMPNPDIRPASLPTDPANIAEVPRPQ